MGLVVLIVRWLLTINESHYSLQRHAHILSLHVCVHGVCSYNAILSYPLKLAQKFGSAEELDKENKPMVRPLIHFQYDVSIWPVYLLGCKGFSDNPW